MVSMGKKRKLPAILADDMLVHVDEKRVYLSFYQIAPPPVVGGTQEERTSEPATATCVSRIAIDPSRAGLFLEALKAATEGHAKTSLASGTNLEEVDDLNDEAWEEVQRTALSVEDLTKVRDFLYRTGQASA
jgi:hypothetical protein